MKIFTLKKGLFIIGLLSFLVMIISLPAVTGAQPPGDPPGANVNANFYSVTITDGTTPSLLMANDGHVENPSGDVVMLDDTFELTGDIIMHGDDLGNAQKIYNPDTYFSSSRELEYPVQIDDNLISTGGIYSESGMSAPLGGFGWAEINELQTDKITQTSGFDDFVIFDTNMDLRDTIYNSLGNVSIDDHLKVTGGIGSYVRVSDSVNIDNNAYGYAAATCPTGYKIAACGHQFTKVDSAVYYNIPYENYCSTSFYNMTGQNNRLFYSHALCFNPNG